MYSVVLMMALSGGAESTDFGHKCNGCSSSCHATAAPSCSCSCSGRKKLFGGGLFHKNSCHGCTAPVSCCAPVAVSCCGGSVAPVPAKDMPKEPMPAPGTKTKTTMVPTTDAVAAQGTVSGVTTTEYRMVATTPGLIRGRLFSR